MWKLSVQSVNELKTNLHLFGRYDLWWPSGDPLSCNMDRPDKLPKFIGQIAETQKYQGFVPLLQAFIAKP
jgi:hypothetical protein